MSIKKLLKSPGLLIRVGALIALSVIAGTKLQNAGEYHKRQNEVIRREEVPEQVERTLWVGSREKESIVLRMDGEAYTELLNEPRDALSQLDYKKFAQTDKTLEEIAGRVLSAKGVNFTHLTDAPFRDDKNLREHYAEEFFGEDYVRVLDFVHKNTKYVEDEGPGYAQRPLETLLKGTGDCEDMAYLSAALLRGKRDIGIVYEFGEGKAGHATIAIGLRPGERVPETIVYDGKKQIEKSWEFLKTGTISNETPISEAYDKIFKLAPEIITERRKARTITYEGKGYFLVETTGTAFDLKTELRKDYQFKLLE